MCEMIVDAIQGYQVYNVYVVTSTHIHKNFSICSSMNNRNKLFNSVSWLSGILIIQFLKAIIQFDPFSHMQHDMWIQLMIAIDLPPYG